MLHTVTIIILAWIGASIPTALIVGRLFRAGKGDEQ
jgi:hypothetical protein